MCEMAAGSVRASCSAGGASGVADGAASNVTVLIGDRDVCVNRGCNRPIGGAEMCTNLRRYAAVKEKREGSDKSVRLSIIWWEDLP